MIDPASVAYDIDGVVADTMKLFIEIARDEFNIKGIRYKDITSYSLEECLKIDRQILEDISDKIVNGNYNGSLEPIKGSAEVLRRICRHNIQILFVTARPTSDHIQNWLFKYLDIKPDLIQVIATGTYEGKVDVLLENCMKYFVEDRLETCFLLEKSGIVPILFQQPWNREKHPFLEIKNWKEFEGLMEF